MKNTVQLIGYVGRNPETKTTNAGKKYTTFTLATTEAYKDKQGQKVENTVWHNIILWDKLAEIAERYVIKGSQVGIQAKLTNRAVKDAQGNDRTEYGLQVLDMLLLGGKRPEAGANNSAPQNAQQSNNIISKRELEENLPF
jgi:single-strand DNA-binding protein